MLPLIAWTPFWHIRGQFAFPSEFHLAFNLELLLSFLTGRADVPGTQTAQAEVFTALSPVF